MKLCRLARISALFVLGSVLGFSQAVTSSILGIVVDPSGSVIPAAEVKLTNNGTAAVNTTLTDTSGFFRVPNILAGSYTVSVQAKGFKVLAINSVDIGTGEAHDLGKIILTLGSMTDSISVTGEIAA